MEVIVIYTGEIIWFNFLSILVRHTIGAGEVDEVSAADERIERVESELRVWGAAARRGARESLEPATGRVHLMRGLLLVGRIVLLVRALQRTGGSWALFARTRSDSRRRLGRCDRGRAARLLARECSAKRKWLLATGEDDFALRLVARELPVPTLQRVPDAAHKHFTLIY